MIKNNGKKLENIVTLIQETLRDSPNTIIYTNAKVKNVSGRKREFDVLIETKINNFNLKIAIECKDYKTAVSVEKIEAFHGKCSRVPDINKKVFVSANGYQEDAINAAKDFGIDLFNVEDINHSTISGWIPIKSLGLRFLLREFQIALITTEIEIEKLNKLSNSSLKVNNEIIDDVKGYIDDLIAQNKEHIWSFCLFEFMKNPSDSRIEKITNLPFKIGFQNTYIVTDSGENYPVGEINGSFDAWLVESDPESIISKSYTNDGESQAQYVAVDHGMHGKTEIVLTETKYKMFHTDVEGNRYEFKQLGIYDPKTDKFTHKV